MLRVNNLKIGERDFHFLHLNSFQAGHLDDLLLPLRPEDTKIPSRARGWKSTWECLPEWPSDEGLPPPTDYTPQPLTFGEGTDAEGAMRQRPHEHNVALVRYREMSSLFSSIREDGQRNAAVFDYVMAALTTMRQQIDGFAHALEANRRQPYRPASGEEDQRHEMALEQQPAIVDHVVVPATA
eukprot:TRINITY_DN1964_c0_g2_i2.p2 TRINITY_DN1964_c0_g2~~TRINITY_DN1964_c0_g2_i2.p2  ORF type:complete len:183 (-),score=24.91 TRINITY_DN1964_c0_g2_i2:226-774(-)